MAKDKYTSEDVADWKKQHDYANEHNALNHKPDQKYDVTNPETVTKEERTGYHDYLKEKLGEKMTDREMFDQPGEDCLPCDTEYKEPLKAATDKLFSDLDKVFAQQYADQPSAPPSTMKFHEDGYLAEVRDYVAKTYDGHYANGDTQFFELIASSPSKAEGFTMGNIIKYATRYGTKDGRNRKDLLKIIHYGLLQLWVHDKSRKDVS